MTVSVFEDLKEKLISSGRSYDVGLIESAYLMAERLHLGQSRYSGEPYIIHPVEVAKILVELGMDTDTIVAALLHDVIEDTNVDVDEMKKLFGEDVTALVKGVTKLGKVPLYTREEQQAENIRKMLFAMSEDIRVVIIKLADRLHNMRTIDSMYPQKQRDKALETMEVYAPIAHRLGMTGIKEELEDISLKYLDPIGYKDIENALNTKKEERLKFLNNIKLKILSRISEINPESYIEGRVKSIYGIYRKVYMQGRNFEEIFDIYAIRIIVNTVNECYNVLGLIHDMFRPIPDRFKDYISTPKQNMYQSLHTAVIDKEGSPFEVQIRTWDMNYTSEYGIAAHWKYKVGIMGKDKLEERLAWVRQLLEVQKEFDDVEDIVKTIKNELTIEDVFVFTPKGDVISIPNGSTPIDFAYAIHSAVGNKMVGAKVGGRIVPIDYQIKTGDVIEIITTNSPNHGPSRDWINIVKTNEARGKIRSWFKKERREENVEKGRLDIEKEFRKNNINLKNEEFTRFLLNIAKRQHFENIDDFYAAIGYGGVVLSKIIPRIRDEYLKIIKQNEPSKLDIPEFEIGIDSSKSTEGVIVDGLGNCLVKFARCCNPLPGDEIIGFITRGYGVSIHKCDCQNVVEGKKNLAADDRWVRVRWAQKLKEKFKTTIQIMADNRDGIIADITSSLSSMHIPIHTLNARETKNQVGIITMTIGIDDIKHLSVVTSKLSKIKGINGIERAGV